MSDGYPLGVDCDLDSIKSSLGRMLPTLTEVNESFVLLAESLYDPCPRAAQVRAADSNR